MAVGAADDAFAKLRHEHLSTARHADKPLDRGALTAANVIAFQYHRIGFATIHTRVCLQELEHEACVFVATASGPRHDCRASAIVVTLVMPLLMQPHA
jgi:hypothetical protein